MGTDFKFLNSKPVIHPGILGEHRSHLVGRHVGLEVAIPGADRTPQVLELAVVPGTQRAARCLNGSFQYLGSFLWVSIYKRAILLGVHIAAPDFWRLLNEGSHSWAPHQVLVSGSWASCGRDSNGEISILASLRRWPPN